MTVVLSVGKKLLKLVCTLGLFAIKIIYSATEESTTKRYGHGEAYGLLHDDKITIAEFVESISD